MPYLVYEVSIRNGQWQPLKAIWPADLPGSTTDISHGRGDLILFSCTGYTSVITRAISHEATALGFGGMRAVMLNPSALLPLARLSHMDRKFELDMCTAKGLRYRGRWTHHD